MNNRNSRPDSAGETWIPLSQRLRTGKVIEARHATEMGIEYLIMPGGTLNPGAEESAEVAVQETSNAGTVKKMSKTYYVLVEQKELGSGGFGVVHMAKLTDESQKMDKAICLKQARSRQFEILIKENEIFTHLSNHPHKHIIKREFLCHSCSDYFLGLEFFSGYTLADMITLKKVHRISIQHGDLVMILRQQTDAIEHLQRNGIAHCDIKPENIMYHIEQKQSMLIDFGLAVYRYGLSESFKAHGGTTVYMAPETLVDGLLYMGTDIFSLGATLHHVMTLETPWYSLLSISEIINVPIDHSLPTVAHLKAQRRKNIKEAIRNEIHRFRAECPSSRMVIQKELEECEVFDGNIRDIIFKMLQHDPESRPICTDILNYLKSSASDDRLVNRQISQKPSTSRLCSPEQISGEQTLVSTNSSARHPIFILSSGKTDSSMQTSEQSNAMIQPVHNDDSPENQPDLNMLVNMSSHLDNFQVNSTPNIDFRMHHPSDDRRQEMDEVSAQMMSLTTSSASGLQPSENEYIVSDRTGMTDYAAGHFTQPPDTLSSFSMPEYDPSEPPERNTVVATDHNYIRLMPNTPKVQPVKDNFRSPEEVDEEDEES